MSDFIEEKTYEEIYEEMAEQFKNESGYDADNASDIGIRMKVLAGQIYSLNKKLNMIWKQAFPNTASGEYLDNHAMQKGISRINGSYANGTVIFSVETPAENDIEIESGTIVSTGSFETSVRFELLETAVIQAGETEATGQVQAVEPGIYGNVPAGAIKVIEGANSQNISVTNSEAFFSGTEDETDEALRNRVTEAYQKPVADSNESYFRAMAMSFDEVTSAGVVPKARGNGTVNIAIETADRTLSASLLSRLRQLFQENHEFGCDVAFVRPTYQSVNISGDITVMNGYAPSEVVSACEDMVERKMSAKGVGDGLIVAELIRDLMAVEGVKNVAVFSPATDIEVSQQVRLEAGTVTLNAIR